MKCVACDLENPQTEEFCYRCAHPLDLSDIDTVPPRQTRAGRLMWTLGSGPVWGRRQSRYIGLLHHRLTVWILSALPGTGHLILGRRRWAIGLITAWLVICSIQGELSIRPQGFCMMLQCFAMSDIYRIATDRHVGLPEMVAVNVVSAVTLALLEMMLIGGILW